MVNVNHHYRNFFKVKKTKVYNMSEDPHINDLYEDMERLNSLYEELMWAHDIPLEFIPDYENNRIIIQPKNRRLDIKFSKQT